MLKKLIEKWKENQRLNQMKKKEKEFLTYKDGKIQPIPKLEGEETGDIQKQSLEVPVDKNASFGLSIPIKFLLGIMMVVLAIWIGLEINQLIKNPTPIDKDNAPIEQVPPNEQLPSTVFPTPDESNGKDTDEKDKSTVDDLFTSDKAKAISLLDITNETNQNLLNILAANEKAIGEYKNQYLNRVSLQAKLNSKLPEIDSFLTVFSSYEETFEGVGLGDLFSTSLQRYENLSMYGKEQYSVSKEYGMSFDALRAKYVESDELYAELQREAIISFLTKSKIEFSINPVTNKIEYSK